jgi:hypothetical protein
MAKRVYVINQGGHDYTSAERYGTLVFLTKGRVRNAYSTTMMYRNFSEDMQESQADDFILLTGLGVMNVIACSIFAYKHGKINLLIYAGKNRYTVRTIVLSELLAREELPICN